MMFFSLLSTAISSIFYGIVVTAVVMTILYFVLKSLSRGIVETAAFFITGILLAALLVTQVSLLIGAIQAKDAVDSAEILLNQMLENSYGEVSAQDSQHLLDTVTEAYPVIGTYFGVADFSGQDVSDVASAMHDEMISRLNTFIWHRVWWILGVVVVACVIVMLFDKGSSSKDQPIRHAKVASRKNYDDF